MNKRRRFKAHRRRKAKTLDTRMKWRMFYKAVMFSLMYGNSKKTADYHAHVLKKAIGAGYIRSKKYQNRSHKQWQQFLKSVARSLPSPSSKATLNSGP